jgi:isochorismate synthase
MQDTVQNKVSIINALELCLDRQVHFAAYKLPGKNPITLVIQKDPVLSPLAEIIDKLPGKGFLIAPFSSEDNQTYLIKPEMLIRDEIGFREIEMLKSLPPRITGISNGSEPEDTDKDDYIQLVRESIQRINTGEFEKVVLSRVKSVAGNFSTQLSAIFQTLCDIYANAFVYLFHINGQCWTGATPEPFVCSSQDNLHTVSMAGTRPWQDRNLDILQWNHKELQEQEYVTLHIERILKEYNVTAFTRNGPYVNRAGNLLHLRTDFNFSAHSVGSRLPSLIHALHPTPAVCGMSTGSALDFIRYSEKHNREYYTGFLGPVGIDDLLQLYVNLRCLKVHADRLVLYTGGGITHDSNPEEEWDETEIKADTLLSVIYQIR